MPDPPPFVPAYGAVQDVVGYGFFFVTVRAIGPTIVSVVAERGIDPALASFGLAVALWVLLGLTLVGVFQAQWRATHRRTNLPDEQVLRDRSRPPSTARLGTFLVVAAIAGAFVVSFWGRFVAALLAIVGWVGTFPELAFSRVAIAWIVAMGIAMGAFGWCLDRAVIGAIRRQLSDRDSEATPQY